MTISTNERVRKHRDTLRAAGLRPLQIWVPDTRKPGFEQECRRQSLATTKADTADRGLAEFLDDALNDVFGEKDGM